MKQLGSLLGLLALIVICWQYPILYPLKLLVVFFHESSHALATLFTGGSVKELVIVPQEGGHVVSQGGNTFIIFSAGYLGSLLWGVAIYLASVKTRYDQLIMMILGSIVIIITVLFGRSLFSWVFGLLIGSAMIFSGKRLSEEVNDFALRIIGLTNMLYVPLDIYSDTISRSYLHSDAYLLAQATFGTTLMWGGIWLLVSLAVIIYCLKWSLVHQQTTTQ
ncbi:hypothetical protein DOJK_00937 [Patescibacteria group bacterium]|nr:hypothetical protein DOJK_00937 [Patescibacteria group bacterium]